MSISSIGQDSELNSKRSNATISTGVNNSLNEFSEYQTLLINKVEKKNEWSKIALANLFEANQQLKTYKTLLNEPNVKVEFNEKGSTLWKYCPVIKTEFLFDPKWKVEHILFALEPE
jgi:hypothetical protein